MSENEVIAALDSGAYGLVGCGGVAGIMLFPVGTHECQCSNLVRGREGGKRFMSLGLITGALPCSSPTKIIRILHTWYRGSFRLLLGKEKERSGGRRNGATTFFCEEKDVTICTELISVVIAFVLGSCEGRMTSYHKSS